MSAKRKLDIDEQKTRVIAAVQQLGLFSIDEIYREYYDMTPEEIKEMKAELEKQREEEAERMQEEQAMMGGMPGMEGAPMGGAPMGGGPPMAGPTPEEAGGQEGLENVPPTAEETVYNLETVKDSILEEDKKEVISRIIEKQQQKA